MSSSGKVKVAVYSGSGESNVKGFINEMQERMSDYIEDHVQYVHLPYNVRDMNKMKLDKTYHMVLCHSIDNRRFSITNVTDALYDNFLRKAKKELGQRKVCVIAHDFPSDDITPGKLESWMESFRIHQERTFRKSILQLVGGKLSDENVQLTDEQWQGIEKFLKHELKTPKTSKCRFGCGRGSPTNP